MRRLAFGLLPFALLVGTGLRGLDFGFHWDEPYHAGTVRSSIERGVPLPGDYRYPQVSHWLGLAGLLPDWVDGIRFAGSPDRIRTLLLRRVEGLPYRLRTRAIFLVLSALGVIATQALVLVWRRRPGEAWIAACTLGCSWEVAYHLRWIAPDGIMMQLGVWTLLCAFLAVQRPERRRWLWLAAALAGAVCGTKWPAGLFLLPVAVAAWRVADAGLRDRLGLLARVCGIFAVSYLLTTPGTLLEFDRFVESIALQQATYGSGHLGHTVSPGPAHALRIFEYLALSLASHFTWIAVTFSGLALLGLLALLRDERRSALLFLSFPVAYLLFFSAYPVMIPRNYLVVAPFFAVLAARGCTSLAEVLPGALGRKAVFAGVGALLAVNAVWLVEAAETIRLEDRGVFVRQLADYIDDRPETRFAVSAKLRGQLASLDAQPRPNVVAGPLEDVQAVVLYASDDYPRIVGCRPGHDLTLTWFGPYEVNFDYYPSWLGSDRIVVLPVSHFPSRRFLPPDTPVNLKPGAIQQH